MYMAWSQPDLNLRSKALLSMTFFLGGGEGTQEPLPNTKEMAETHGIDST